MVHLLALWASVNVLASTTKVVLREQKTMMQIYSVTIAVRHHFTWHDVWEVRMCVQLQILWPTHWPTDCWTIPNIAHVPFYMIVLLMSHLRHTSLNPSKWRNVSGMTYWDKHSYAPGYCFQTEPSPKTSIQLLITKFLKLPHACIYMSELTPWHPPWLCLLATSMTLYYQTMYNT